MNKCLVTTLKASTNNEALSKYNVLTIKTKASDSPTMNTQWFFIGTSNNGNISINSTSVGLYYDGISGATYPYPHQLIANTIINSHFENKDGIIEITGKYNISKISLGNNATIKIKEIYGIPGTITNINIQLSNIEEGEIDVAKLKNALNIGGLTEILVPTRVNFINKLNKNTLNEFTSLESFHDGTAVLFESRVGLDDLSNVTSLKTIINLVSEGNLSSLAKLINLTLFRFNEYIQHKGDIMDFINPWIQAGRTSGKIKTPNINSQHIITLNGSPLSLPSEVVGDNCYLNWTSDGRVTFTAS